MFFFFKQKTAYEMRISDWSSDVCSSDLQPVAKCGGNECGRSPDKAKGCPVILLQHTGPRENGVISESGRGPLRQVASQPDHHPGKRGQRQANQKVDRKGHRTRSEEHTSELQSLMRTSYAVFCLEQKRNTHTRN